MIPPLHFTQVGDHLLRERPLMETAALRSTDVIRRGHGLRRRLRCSEERNMEEPAGQPDARRGAVTPPLAVAPVTQEDDMRWNPNDDGIVFNP